MNYQLIHQQAALPGPLALSITHMCQTLGVARVGYYQWLAATPEPQQEQAADDILVRDHIQRIVLEMPCSPRGCPLSTHHTRTAPPRFHRQPQAPFTLDAGR